MFFICFRSSRGSFGSSAEPTTPSSITAVEELFEEAIAVEDSDKAVFESSNCKDSVSNTTNKPNQTKEFSIQVPYHNNNNTPTATTEYSTIKAIAAASLGKSSTCIVDFSCVALFLNSVRLVKYKNGMLGNYQHY